MLLSSLCAWLAAGCHRHVAAVVPAVVPPAPTAASARAFPLVRQAGMRCLVDQAGAPFLMQGDTPWSLLVQLKREEVERYLADRRRRGFNTLLVNLIEHQYADHAPRNAYGEAPFLDAGDFSRPNEKYFQHVDWVLTRAAEEGFVVLLTPAYMGFQGGAEGWFQEMREAGTARLRAYGRYLGLRYHNLPNVIWMDGGDYAPAEPALPRAIMEGIRETDPAALHSYHAGRGTSAREYVGGIPGWLDLNTVYTNKDGVVASARREYAASPLPFILVEALYEWEGATPEIVRAQAYQAMLSGACGQQLGNRRLWSFDAGVWEAQLDSPGARSMTTLRDILGRLAWWQLRPAPDAFIAAGAGTGIDRAAAAIAADGSYALLYVPSRRPVTLDAAALGTAALRAQWIDPTSGAMTEATPEAGSPSPTYVPPGPNRGRGGDWLLRIDAVR